MDINHSPWRLVTEGFVYGLLSLPALLVLRDLVALRGHRRPLRLLLAGYAAYATAALASWSSNAGDWYAVAGNRLLAGPMSWLPRMQDQPGFWLFDRLFEESVELVGATCLCAAVVAFLVPTAVEAPALEQPPHAAAKGLSRPAEQLGDLVDEHHDAGDGDHAQAGPAVGGREPQDFRRGS